MYGTIAQLNVKPGQLEAFQKGMSGFEEMDSEGYVATYAYQMDADPNVLYMVVMFESKEAYHTNAQSDETNQQFMKMMEFLTTEPEWHDGEIIYENEA